MLADREPPDLHAPEQKAGREPDMRSDIYTLGIILQILLSKAVNAGVSTGS